MADPQWPLRRPGAPALVLAHRGAPGPWRENTLEAFAAALAGGADGVELDVRLSADGVALVHHDPEIPGAGAVHLVTSAQVPAWVPTLEQALVSCAGAVVDVEMKNSPLEPGYDPGQRLAACVAEVVGRAASGVPTGGGGPAAVLVSSFWPESLSALRAAAGELATGLLLAPALGVDSAVVQAEACGASTVLPFGAQVTETLVAQAHGRGLAVVPWAVDEQGGLEAMSAVGVDGVVTDHVRRALAAFCRR